MLNRHGVHKPDYYVRNRNKILAYSRKYHKEHPEVARKATTKYQQLNPEMLKAHNLSRTLRRGTECELCGSAKDLDKHHPDYSHPKIVVTLCKTCHKYIHRREGE